MGQSLISASHGGKEDFGRRLGVEAGAREKAAAAGWEGEGTWTVMRGAEP